MIVYHFSWSCGGSHVSGHSSKTTPVEFFIQVKAPSTKISFLGWNISQKFKLSLWNYIFISHEIRSFFFFFLHIDYFFPKAIKRCMKEREVTIKIQKVLRIIIWITKNNHIVN